MTRAYERQLRRREGKSEIAKRHKKGGDESIKAGEEAFAEYKRIMDVTFVHPYYNANDDQCTAFRVFPTVATASVFRRLGLTFKERPDGFQILLDMNKEKGLFRYLIRQQTPELDEYGGAPSASSGQSNDLSAQLYSWARLSFVMSLDDPQFLNFTDINYVINPAVKNLHASNFGTSANGTDEPIELSLSKVGYQTVAAQYSLEVGSEASKYLVEFFDLSWGKDNPDAAVATSCVNAQNYVYADFSQVAEGLYTLKATPCKESEDPLSADKCETISGEDSYITRHPVIYTASYPIPVVFLDLMLTKTSSEDSGQYPVPRLSGTLTDPAGKVTPRSYELEFAVRKARWRYEIIVPDDSDYYDFRVVDANGELDFEQQGDPIEGQGSLTYQFLSKQKIAYQEQPTQHIILKGRCDVREDGDLVDLINPLPVASAATVDTRNKSSGRRNPTKEVPRIAPIYVSLPESNKSRRRRMPAR